MKPAHYLIGALSGIILLAAGSMFFFHEREPNGPQANTPAPETAMPSAPSRDAASAAHMTTAGTPEPSTAKYRDRTPAPSRQQHSLSSPPASRARHQLMLSDDPETLADIFIDEAQGKERDKEVMFKALQKLTNQALDNSEAAVSQLRRIGDTIMSWPQDPDTRAMLHTVLQSLGRMGTPEANEALLEAIQRSTENPVETLRITSYLAPAENGLLEPTVVDRLLDIAGQQSIPSESKRVIISAIRERGGKYGFTATANLDRQ